jgi:Putative homoserine kinase type II (protein kinase fold)
MSSKATAHGMVGDLVEPDWPALTPAELRILFEQFPSLNGPIEILTESPRPLSAAGVVNTRAGKFFVKRHHRIVRDRQGLAEEHAFMQHLANAGASVPAVIVSDAGETAVEIGEWTYEVHSIPAGIDLYHDAISWTPFFSAPHAYSAGQALAHLHLAAEGFNAPLRKLQPLVASFTIFAARDASAAMKTYLTARPILAAHKAVKACCDQALELLAPFHDRLKPLLPSLRELWTHNDLHCSNLLWSGTGSEAKATAIFDFGLADRTNAVHDIANAIERNIVEWLQLVADPTHPNNVTVHFDHLDALLAGYESVRSLSDGEAEALLPMTALCHAEFALSEAEYFLGALQSEEKGPLAYDGWLVGHARWFYSDAGKALLAAIERWASNRRTSGRKAGAQ